MATGSVCLTECGEVSQFVTAVQFAVVREVPIARRQKDMQVSNKRGRTEFRGVGDSAKRKGEA